jgi:hypothetical protein
LRHAEQSLQTAVASYLGWALPEYAAWFSTIPSGGGGLLRGKILKGMGLKAGVPDILIISDGRPYFIELKTARGTLSASQKETIRRLREAGAQVQICRSLEDVRDVIVNVWGIPLRAHRPDIEAIERGLAMAACDADCPMPENTIKPMRRRRAD